MDRSRQFPFALYTSGDFDSLQMHMVCCMVAVPFLVTLIFSHTLASCPLSLPFSLSHSLSHSRSLSLSISLSISLSFSLSLSLSFSLSHSLSLSLILSLSHFLSLSHSLSLPLSLSCDRSCIISFFIFSHRTHNYDYLGLISCKFSPLSKNNRF